MDYTRKRYTWLVLDLPEFDWKACYDEAMAVYDEAIQHRKNDYDESNPDDYGHRGWRSLTLHGLGKHVSQHWDSKDVIEAVSFLRTNNRLEKPITGQR